MQARFGGGARAFEPLGDGWTYHTYLADGEWVFQFPRLPGEDETLRKQIALLPGLAARVSRSVPAPVHVSTDPPCSETCGSLLALRTRGGRRNIEHGLRVLGGGIGGGGQLGRHRARRRAQLGQYGTKRDPPEDHHHQHERREGEVGQHVAAIAGENTIESACHHVRHQCSERADSVRRASIHNGTASPPIILTPSLSHPRRTPVAPSQASPPGRGCTQP